MSDELKKQKESLVNVNIADIDIRDEFAPITFALVGAVFISILLAFTKISAPVLVPILMAIYIAALCLPIYSWLLGKGVNKKLSLVVMIFIVILGLGVIGLLLLAGVNRLRTGLEDYASGLASQVPRIETLLNDFNLESVDLDNEINSEAITGFLVTFLGAIASGLGDFLFSLVLVAFFILEADRFFELANTKLRNRPLFGKVPVIMKTAVTYFGVRTRLNFVTGVSFGIVLFLLGVDYALLWGALAFILSYVPYVGLLTAMIPPTILALAEYGIGRALLVIAAAILINLLIENILEPTYTGKKLKLSPTIVFVSFFIWGWLLGPAGALLSMPITVTLMLVLDEHENTRWAARIIGTSRGGDG